MSFIAPSYAQSAFTCPHCSVLARQYKWGIGTTATGGQWPEPQVPNAPIKLSWCEHCGGNCIWIRDTLVYPDRTSAPAPNPDMPPEVLVDYEEAAQILIKSPRGAAALLRLAIQKLMVHLGEGGRNINDDIGSLVAKGLPRQIQQALDVVRVTGNSAVHPGQLDANDAGIAGQLFGLVNVIVEYQLSLPHRVQAMYDALPGGALQAIVKRDA